MLEYYREPNGDYLCIDTDTADYYWFNFGERMFEGRGTAIGGMKESVCTTGVSIEHLNRCTKVRKEQIPIEWRHRLEGE